jgi:hypothetical protein
MGFTGIDVESRDLESGFGELDRKRKANITKTNNADVRLSSADAVDKGGRSGHVVVADSRQKIKAILPRW